MLKEHKPLNEQNLEELHDTLLTAVEDAVMEMAELQQQQAGTSEHYSGDAGDQLFCARSISCSTNSLIAAATKWLDEPTWYRTRRSAGSIHLAADLVLPGWGLTWGLLFSRRSPLLRLGRLLRLLSMLCSGSHAGKLL